MFDDSDRFPAHEIDLSPNAVIQAYKRDESLNQKVPMTDFPLTSRVWVFATAKVLEDNHVARFDTEFKEFLSGWNSHGEPLRAAYEIHHRRFIVVGVDSSCASASGCAIDRLFRSLKQIAESAGIHLTNSSHVFYLKADEVVALTREAFADFVHSPEFTPSLLVFDTSVTELAAIRASGTKCVSWLKPFSESWHSQAFAMSLEPKQPSS